jgi:hypothetical protein
VRRRITHDIDDTLTTLPMLHGSKRLADELFDRLVDLLLESILVDLAERVADGEIDQDRLQAELLDLANQCRAVGLLLPR